MFGGLSLSHELSAQMSSSDWSVFEGDEYKSGPQDPTPKFKYYRPTHLLLTAVSWDHADLYPTEESYFKVFEDIIKEADEKGIIVACKDDEKTMSLTAQALHVKTYGKSADADYSYSNVVESTHGLSFTIKHNGHEYSISSQLLGKFQAENITGCFAMAHEIGIPPQKIIDAIAEFKGMKRRLERRLSGDIEVFDDIAHSPEKASSVTETLRTIYSGRIIALFEPNIGGRRREAEAKYDHAFKHVDEVIIPRLTKLKIAENEKEEPMEGDELAAVISKTHNNVKYMPDDEAVVEHLISTTKKGDVIVFLGSHGFRNMIESVIEKLKNPSKN